MSPVRLPPLDIIIFRLGEPQTLRVVLQFQRDRVELDLCHDLSILKFGGGVFENSRAVIQIPLLQIQRPRIPDGEAADGAIVSDCDSMPCHETASSSDVLQLCQTECVPDP